MGNIVLATDTNGHEAATYRYTPFGRLTTATGEFKSRYLFSSKEYDDEVGLYYYGYRYYQPDRGRWLTRDPIGERGGQNLYLFVNNNPQWFVDPLGLQAEDPCCINGEHVDCDLAGVGEMFERADVHNKTSAAIFSANLFLGGVGAFKSMAARNAAPAMTSAAKGTLRVGIFTEGGHVAVAGSTPFSTAVQGYNTARNIGALSSSSQKLGPVTAGTLGVKFGSTAKRILDPYGRLSDVENELGLKMSRETYALLGSLQELANEVQELIVQCCD
jgi:RHS repeat-associated protein